MAEDHVAEGVAMRSSEPSMTGAPPFAEAGLVTLGNWQDPPFNRWGFQHIREPAKSWPMKSTDLRCRPKTGSSPSAFVLRPSWRSHPRNQASLIA